MKKTVFLMSFGLACAAPAAGPDFKTTELIRSDYQDGEITRLCDEAIAKTQKRLDSLAAVPEKDRTVGNVLLAFEATMADFSDETSPLTFMSYVSTNDKLNAEGSKCEEKVGQFYVGVTTRRDLYAPIVKTRPKGNRDLSRLYDKTVESFELNGLKLPDEKLAEVKRLKTELSRIETQYSSNLNADKSSVRFTASELQGVPESVIARFAKVGDKYEVTTKTTDAIPILENASKSETRRRMSLAYLTRGGDENLKLLSQALELRRKIAKELGYSTWADYRMITRMAKDKKTAIDFLNGLRTKLARRNEADLAKLLKFKQEIEPGATKLDSWDGTYLAYQLQKRDFNLDDEKIREYFPADLVVDGMFKIYSRLLGVDYKEIVGAKTWASGVKLYEIQDRKSKKTIGYFFADFFPRPGKYGHAAAFPLIAGRKLADGSYAKPVASIVANFTAPADGKPSLLNHDEVGTIFHEFGHIMHQTLTRAPYASLSGAGVPWDFVEAPSQMLENWVWNEKMLSSLSGHYKDHSKKLPPEMLKQMLAARDFNQGVRYTRQLLYALFDMTIHTSPDAVEPNAVYEKLFREIAGLEPLPGGKFPASFGHMMGGYDAGYYGYLWSEVYAEDMFSKFPSKDLTNPKIGGLYRRAILEQGNMREPLESLKAFLGRAPKSDAFFKKLGIK